MSTRYLDEILLGPPFTAETSLHIFTDQNGKFHGEIVMGGAVYTSVHELDGVEGIIEVLNKKCREEIEG